MSIFPIVQYIRKIDEQIGWGYNFKWDQGSFETVMSITEEGHLISQDYLENYEGTYRTFVPDIVDFKNKIIIEFEETYTKRKKGHDPDGMDKRTTRRDIAYKLAGFKLFKIFDYEEPKAWKERLFRFLADVYTTAVLNRPK